MRTFPEKYRYKLSWGKIRDVVDMNYNYQSGFYTEKYSVQLKKGYEKAQAIVDCRMEVKIKENMGDSGPII